MSRKNRFILVLGYVGFLAFLFEGSARLVFSIPQIGKRLQANEDYTYRRNWVHEHQTFGIEAYYTFDMYDPSKGWVPKPNLRDVKAFNNKILNTNSKGLRGKKNFPYTKNKEKVRILILGDSFTFGDEVSDDETYSHYLQEMLPHTEVINMGVHGYGHDQMLILLKEEGVKYQPDIVILGFLPLDMSRNLLEFRDFAKPRFVLESGQLKLTGIPVPRPEDILQWDWIRPRLIDIFSNIRHKVKKELGLQEKEMKDITTAILTDMIRVVEGIHAIPIFAYLPRGREIAKDIAVLEDEVFMFSVCQLNEKAKCFSTRPYFAEKIAKGETFKSSGHWEPAGHLAAAEAIKRYLVDEGHITAP
ncbi:MAG TPA: hypothetical protein VLJ79_28795 [Candidatus Binatia bacterium]|nr:hypothetical protein [Candidatus Binatia bacterium]